MHLAATSSDTCHWVAHHTVEVLTESYYAGQACSAAPILTGPVRDKADQTPSRCLTTTIREGFSPRGDPGSARSSDAAVAYAIVQRQSQVMAC
mmetsp:Transcript_26763/g.36086  ORF Transcript_26763/g.36086 Transcript_26763/m.36086 type:complete len:93 (+) Transcript_26763:214-492(+)